jgi:hypothetical protein
MNILNLMNILTQLDSKNICTKLDINPTAPIDRTDIERYSFYIIKPIRWSYDLQ